MDGSPAMITVLLEIFSRMHALKKLEKKYKKNAMNK